MLLDAWPTAQRPGLTPLALRISSLAVATRPRLRACFYQGEKGSPSVSHEVDFSALAQSAAIEGSGELCGEVSEPSGHCTLEFLPISPKMLQKKLLSSPATPSPADSTLGLKIWP